MKCTVFYKDIFIFFVHCSTQIKEIDLIITQLYLVYQCLSKHMEAIFIKNLYFIH